MGLDFVLGEAEHAVPRRATSGRARVGLPPVGAIFAVFSKLLLHEAVRVHLVVVDFSLRRNFLQVDVHLSIQVVVQVDGAVHHPEADSLPRAVVLWCRRPHVPVLFQMRLAVLPGAKCFPDIIVFELVRLLWLFALHEFILLLGGQAQPRVLFAAVDG